MLYPLIYDSRFVPCQAESGDELFRNGIFEFNISKLTEYLQSDTSQVPLEQVPTNRFPVEFSTLNESYLEFVSLVKPGIIAEIAPNQYNLIDGHHRMEKARRACVDFLPCYILDASLHVNYLTTLEAYESYIKYWNEKLR